MSKECINLENHRVFDMDQKCNKTRENDRVFDMDQKCNKI